MQALRLAGLVPPPAALTFASLTGTQRMGKHLQFGKGEVFFHVQADGQDTPWDTRLSLTHPVCSFVLQSLFRTAVTFRGAENTRPASKSLAPNTGRNSKLAVYLINLCPALK